MAGQEEIIRVVIVGASPLGILTAKLLLAQRNDVVLIEKDRARIDELSENLDCAYIHGDGSKPAILREADPGDSDLLFCLSNDDQDNIIAALVGKSLGFARAVPKIEDPEYEHICVELGLESTIVPDRAIARLLVDMSEGRDPLELSSVMKAGVRFFAFVAREEHEAKATELDLPDDTRAVFLYRSGKFVPVDPETEIRRQDEVVLVTQQDRIDELRDLLGVSGP